MRPGTLFTSTGLSNRRPVHTSVRCVLTLSTEPYATHQLQDAARRRQVAKSLLGRSKPLVDATTRSGEASRGSRGRSRPGEGRRVFGGGGVEAGVLEVEEWRILSGGIFEVSSCTDEGLKFEAG